MAGLGRSLAAREDVRVGIAVSGQAVRGFHHIGAVRRVHSGLREIGYDRGLYAVAGSSSGSLATISAPPEFEVADLDFRDLVLRYVSKTGGRDSAQYVFDELASRLRNRLFPEAAFQLHPLLPHPEAMREIFDELEGRQLFAKALDSEVLLGFTATEVDSTLLNDSMRRLMDVGLLGVRRMLPRAPELLGDQLTRSIDELAMAGRAALAPAYFVNRWPNAEDPLVVDQPDNVTVLQDAQQVRKAVEASSRIPGIFTHGFEGAPVIEGGNALVDGAYSNNSPLELLLQMGATDVFLLNDGRNPNVYHEREFQRMALGPAARRLGLMAHMQGLHIEDLRARYPDRRIHVVGRHPDFPRDVGQVWDRFFLSDPDRVSRILDLAPHVAQQILDLVPRPS